MLIFVRVFHFNPKKVDFDKTKHLSEYSIKKRAVEREKLMSIQREREEKVRKHKELEDMKVESER